MIERIFALGRTYSLLLVAVLITLASTLTIPLRDTAQVYELATIGNAWFGGGSIPIVQAYSTSGPLLLFLASLFDFVALYAYIDLLIALAILGLVYILLGQRDYARPHRDMIIIMVAVLFWVPGIFGVGLTVHKIATLLLLCLFVSFEQWKKSGKSYWLLGETAKNWRWLLLAGVAYSLLTFVSVLYAIFASLVLVELYMYYRKNRRAFGRSVLFFVIPFLLHCWIWISFFSSRGLLGEALGLGRFDLRMTLSNSVISSEWSLYILGLIGASVLLALSVRGAKGRNLRTNVSGWLASLLLIFVILYSGISSVTLLLPLFVVLLATQKISLKKVQRYIPSAVLLVFLIALPYRLAIETNATLENSLRENVAITLGVLDANADEPVLYIGNGAGFYVQSGFTGSTRFYEKRVMEFDQNSELLGYLRGDNEGNKPIYVVVALSAPFKLSENEELSEYLDRHYQEESRPDGYVILKRKVQD